MRDWFDTYSQLHKFAPLAHQHAHLVTTGLTERMQTAATLHCKAMGRESLHDVTIEELLTHMAAQYGALDYYKRWVQPYRCVSAVTVQYQAVRGTETRPNRQLTYLLLSP